MINTDATQLFVKLETSSFLCATLHASSCTKKLLQQASWSTRPRSSGHVLASFLMWHEKELGQDITPDVQVLCTSRLVQDSYTSFSTVCHQHSWNSLK